MESSVPKERLPNPNEERSIPKGKGRRRGPRKSRRGPREVPSKSPEPSKTASSKSSSSSAEKTEDEKRVHNFCRSTGMILTKKSKLIQDTLEHRGYIATLRISLGGKKMRDDLPIPDVPSRGRPREGKLLVSKTSFVSIEREKAWEEDEEFRDLWPRILKSLRIKPQDFLSNEVKVDRLSDEVDGFRRSESKPQDKGQRAFPFPILERREPSTPFEGRGVGGVVDFSQLGNILKDQTEAERLKQTQNMLRPYLEVFGHEGVPQMSPELSTIIGAFMSASPEDIANEQFMKGMEERSRNLMGEMIGFIPDPTQQDLVKGMYFDRSLGADHLNKVKGSSLSKERLARILLAEESPDEAVDEDPTVDPELDDELRDILGS